MPNFVLPTPSFQRMAAIKAVAGLWNQPDILTQVAELINGAKEQVPIKWKVILEAVKTKALGVELPEPCKQHLLNLITLMGNEIRYWCSYHYLDNNNFLKCSLPKQFCWTMHGTIDYAETAELIVKDERLSVERRYEIACMNCLKDRARELFPLVAVDRRREYMNKVIDINENGHDHLIVYFSCAVSGDLDQLISAFRPVIGRGSTIHDYQFVKAISSSNRATCEYFFNKLNQAGKDLLLGGAMASAIFARYVKVPHCNLLYFLSLMSEEQRERLLRERMSDVLIYLLSWPMQSLFMEAAECGRRYLKKADYEKVRDAYEIKRRRASANS